MMNFDTLNAVKQLQLFGFEPRQAEGVVEVLKETQSASIENLATKDDLKAVETSLHGDIKELRGEIKDLRSDMKTQETIINVKIDAIRAEFAIFKWILGVLTAAVVSFVIKSFFS